MPTAARSALSPDLLPVSAARSSSSSLTPVRTSRSPDVHHQAGLKETAALIPGGARAKTDPSAVSSMQAVQTHAEDVLADFGSVDYVFNSAGATLAATIEHPTLHEFERLLGINFRGSIYGTKAFLPTMVG
jgi:NAD(P)-dependent dehydrogenase (short-subunit alcohol dehydrogenase family)